MSDITIAILVSALLSVPLSFIQISADAKTSDIRSMKTVSFFLYLLITIAGNSITTLIAVNVIENFSSTPSDAGQTPTVNGKSVFLTGPPWIWYAVFGVFGFEAIVQKINVTFLDHGVLSVSDWFTKAKKSATAATLEKQVNLGFQDTQKLANQLIQKLDSESIRTFASIRLGLQRYEQLINSIEDNPNINQDEFIAYILSEQCPREVKARIKTKDT